MCIQVCRTVKLNSDYQSQVLVQKHQHSECIRKHVKQKTNLYGLGQDLKKGKLKSQCSDYFSFRSI